MVRFANKPSRIEASEVGKLSNVSDANGCQRKFIGFVVQPTAEEVSRLTFGKRCDTGIHSTERRNQFAHLLNRGSSLE
jgi:hypothetical protein